MLRLQQHPWWLLEAVHELKPALPLSSTSGICSSSAAILPLTWWPFSVKMAAVWTKQHAGQKDWGLVGFKQMRNSWRNLSVRILYLWTWQTHLDERIIQNQDISATLHLILQNMLISVSLKWRLFHINITLREKPLFYFMHHCRLCCFCLQEQTQMSVWSLSLLQRDWRLKWRKQHDAVTEKSAPLR